MTIELTRDAHLDDADICRRNGWKVGTRLACDEGTTIEITAIGERHLLAKEVHPCPRQETTWTLSCRDWRAISGPGTLEVVGTCPCGKDILANPRVARDRKRKYCSSACSGRHNGPTAASRRPRRPPALESRRCPCGTEFEIDTNRAKDRARKYCSRTCSGKRGGGVSVKEPDVLGTCPCGADIVRNPRRSRYAERDRKYCSKTCASVARRGSATPRKSSPKPEPSKPKATPPTEPAPPPWRPPGWAPEPHIPRRTT